MHLKEPDHTWRIDLNIPTKDGRPIVFTYFSNIEKENRGFICDQINAYVDDQLAGYLKIEYIPSWLFEIYYPDKEISYDQLILGTNLSLRESMFGPPKRIADLSIGELNKLAERLGQRHQIKAIPELATLADFRSWQMTKLAKSRSFQTLQQKYEHFVSSRVDQPIVAFSQTVDPSLTGYGPSWQGKGVGRALYFAMALELERLGLSLRRSTLLSPSATRIWESFERDDLTISLPDGVFLSAKKIKTKYDFSLSSSALFIQP